VTEQIVVVGAGGFGREIVDVIEAINAVEGRPRYELLGVLDDSPTEQNLDRLATRSVQYLGRSEEFLATVAAGTSYVIGVGSPATRRLLAGRFDEAGLDPATLVHPSVTMGAQVSIAPGTVLCAGVRLTTNITIGRHVHVNLNATIGHDSVIGDFVSINPLASISGDCTLGNDVMVGVGGVLLQGLSVGEKAVVGGSACVTKDVPGSTVVAGVPAKSLNASGRGVSS
jgi:sugar O-acyltransferase (sialic acid O-acetyltransferase NeuD family)